MKNGSKMTNVYQTLDQSAPEYVRNLWMTSAVFKKWSEMRYLFWMDIWWKILKNIYQRLIINTFIDQIKIRKKLNFIVK